MAKKKVKKKSVKKPIKKKKSIKLKPTVLAEVKVDTSKLFNAILFDLEIQLNRASQLAVATGVKINQIYCQPSHNDWKDAHTPQDFVSTICNGISRLKEINDVSESNVNSLNNLI